jgi:hypothetical protein
MPAASCGPTRRNCSPWANSRVPLTAPQVATTGASKSGSTPLVSNSTTPSPAPRCRARSRRAVLRPATAIANASASATSPRSVVTTSTAPSPAAASHPIRTHLAPSLGWVWLGRLQPLVLLGADDAAEPQVGGCGVDRLGHPGGRPVAPAVICVGLAGLEPATERL